MLDVRRLSVLREVARHGSLSAEAAALGYTQPAVSRQIAVLESEVGVRLLQRRPSGVVLTEAGRLLVDRADAVIASLARAEDELKALAGVDGGTLRMAVFASGAATVFPLALSRFRERHPRVELSVIVADPVDSLPMLRNDDLDMALCNYNDEAAAYDRHLGRPVDTGGPTVELIRLFDDPMYVAMPAGHPLAGAVELTLADLEREAWMLCTTDTCPDADLFHAACRAAGVEPRIAFQYDHYAALLGFVAAGVGIAVVPDMVARAPRESVTFRQLTPALAPRGVAAAVPADYRSAAVSAMIEILADLAPEWVAGQVEESTLAGAPLSA